jgi:hypothetical protein
MMLVRFHCKAEAFTMLGDTAQTLLRMMGMSGDVPGALLAQDAPQALERLRRALETGKGEKKEDASSGYHEEQKVGLATRAFPLVQLLETATTRKCDVIWEQESKRTG